MGLGFLKPEKTDKFVKFDSNSWEGDSEFFTFYSSGLVEWDNYLTPTSGGSGKGRKKDFALNKQETDEIFEQISKFVQECPEDKLGIDVEKDRFGSTYLIYGFGERGLPFGISSQSPEFEKFEKILAPLWAKLRKK